MRCFDASFVVDLLAGDEGARRKAAELEASGERLSISVPAMAEVLMGAHFAGGAYLRRTLELVAGLEVLPADGALAAEAGELGAELMRRGARPGAADLIVAASARLHRRILLTRDKAFATMPGVAVETY